MTPMVDLFVNIHNETAYANGSSHAMALDVSDWYMQVSAVDS